MDLSGGHLVGTSPVTSPNGTVAVAELPPALLDDSYSPLMSGYTCIDVEDTQYYFPNKLQVVLTLQWLTSNYEIVEGVSLPRCSIYKHYADFCRKQQFQPVNAASFGKVIRQVYPELKTRRLGTRGQSKYHYDGISVKSSSPYYKELSAYQRKCPKPEPSMLSSPGSWSSNTLSNNQSKVHANDPQKFEDRAGDFLLPEFPDAEQIQLNDSTIMGKVDSFLDTYRIHCQKLLHIVLNSKLEEVHFYIERFWRELSGTSQQLLTNRKVAVAVAMCDTLFYKTISSILMPGIVQHLIPSLLHAIRHFSCGFVKHLEGALTHQPPILVEKKVEAAQDFANLLKRKTSLSHLAQAMCTVLKTDGSVKQMLHDWKKRTEHTTVRSQLLWLVNDDDDGPNRQTINKYLSEFVWLLDKHITVEDHLKWLQSVRKRCMSKYDGLDPETKSNHERRFMLQFCYLSNLIIRDQTLRSATSFGSFHLLHLMYEEYLLYVLDVNNIQQHEEALWKQLHGPDAKVPESFLTTLGVESLDKSYAPVFKYLGNMRAKYQSPTTGVTLGSPGSYSQPYQTMDMIQRTVLVPQASPILHTNNSAAPSTPDQTTYHHTPLHNTSTPLMQPNFQMSSPGGYVSNSFAPIQYSPHMTSPRLVLSPLAAPPPRLDFDVPQTMTTTVASGGTLSSALLTSQPLNLSSNTSMKPLTTTQSIDTNKFIATQLLKVSLIDGTDVKDCVNGSSSKSNITLSVPLSQGLHLSKGQILKLSDGKSYNIDEVQTVLKEMNPATTQESVYPTVGGYSTPTKTMSDALSTSIPTK